MATSTDTRAALESSDSNESGGSARLGGDAEPPAVADVSVETLVALWRETLGQPDADADTSFFARGGRSVDAVRLLALVKQATGTEATLRMLYQAATPARLAEILRAGAAGAGADEERDTADQIEEWLWRAVEREEIIGGQLYATRHGRRVVDIAAGFAAPGRQMHRGSMFRWFCGAKPVTALLCGVLVMRGELRWDAPLAEYFPELATSRLGVVTTGQILNSSSGLREREPLAHDRAVLGTLEVEGEPGSVPSYSPYTGWQVLRLIVERVTGRDYVSVVTDDVLTPLRMSATSPLLPAADSSQADDLVMQHVMREGVWLRYEELVEAGDVREMDPGRGFYGPSRDLARIYEELARAPAGRGRLLTPAVATEMLTMRRGRAYDPYIDSECDFAAGLQMDMSDFIPAETCSPRSFGHVGAIVAPLVVGVCDPHTDLIAVLSINGDSGANRPLIAMIVDRLNASRDERTPLLGTAAR